MKTRCSMCRRLTDIGNTYCDTCNTKVIHERNAKKKKNSSYVESTTKSTQWKALRNKVILRDKGNCVLCWKRKIAESRGLQVHHIYKRVDRVDLIYEQSNLVTVCRSCHEELEKLAPSEQLKLLGEFNKELEYNLL